MRSNLLRAVETKLHKQAGLVPEWVLICILHLKQEDDISQDKNYSVFWPTTYKKCYINKDRLD